MNKFTIYHVTSLYKTHTRFSLLHTPTPALYTPPSFWKIHPCNTQIFLVKIYTLGRNTQLEGTYIIAMIKIFFKVLRLYEHTKVMQYQVKNIIPRRKDNSFHRCIWLNQIALYFYSSCIYLRVISLYWAGGKGRGWRRWQQTQPSVSHTLVLERVQSFFFPAPWLHFFKLIFFFFFFFLPWVSPRTREIKTPGAIVI
jgi:hypothetical protein